MTSLVLKNFGSLFGCPYRFENTSRYDTVQLLAAISSASILFSYSINLLELGETYVWNGWAWSSLLRVFECIHFVSTFTTKNYEEISLIQIVRSFIQIFRSFTHSFWSSTKSNHLEMFCNKGVLKRFTGKHLCQIFFFFFFSKVTCFSDKGSGTGIFLLILRNFWENLFCITLPMTGCGVPAVIFRCVSYAVN